MPSVSRRRNAMRPYPGFPCSAAPHREKPAAIIRKTVNQDTTCRTTSTRSAPRPLFPGLRSFYDIVVGPGLAVIRIAVRWSLLMHHWARSYAAISLYPSLHGAGIRWALPWIWAAFDHRVRRHRAHCFRLLRGSSPRRLRSSCSSSPRSLGKPGSPWLTAVTNTRCSGASSASRSRCGAGTILDRSQDRRQAPARRNSSRPIQWRIEHPVLSAIGPDQKGADHYWREALELTLLEQLRLAPMCARSSTIFCPMAASCRSPHLSQCRRCDDALASAGDRRGFPVFQSSSQARRAVGWSMRFPAAAWRWASRAFAPRVRTLRRARWTVPGPVR